MSEFAKKIQKWYNNGLWTRSMVEQAFVKGRITQEEFDEILTEEA